MDVSNLRDIQAESGVIATLLFHPSFILHSENLIPSHFYEKSNGCIYWAIDELFKSGVENIDSFNLITMINSNNAVKKVIDKFNVNTIQELIDLSKHVARDSIEEYILIANRVISLAFKRDLYKKLQEFERITFDEKYDLGGLNNYVYDNLNKLSEQYIITSEIQLFGDKMDGLLDKLNKRKLGGDMYGIPSKFEMVNKYCPYEKGELVILSAPRKTGKSIYMLNECANKLKNGVPVFYLDTEMSSSNFMERMLAHLAQVDVHRIKSGNYYQGEEEKVNDAIKFLKKAPLYHEYRPLLDHNLIYTMCKILQNKAGIQFFIYDYLKSSESDIGKQYIDMGNTTNFLKNNVGGKLDLPVLAGAQLNRKNEIGGSYQIEQFASTVLNLIPKTTEEILRDGQECGNYKLFVKLNRNGEQMVDPEEEYIDLYFNGNLATIDQAKEQHEINELPI